MPQLSPIPLWRQSGEGKTKEVSAEKLTNWFMEPNPNNQEFPYVLLPTPGLKLLATVGDGPIRGMFRLAGDLFVVSGEELYRVFSNYTYELIGTVSGVGPVSMTENGTHVLITTSGSHSYAANASEIIEIPEPDLRGAAYQDGYGIAFKGGTEQFYLSGIDDMTSWAALDFSSADSFADNIIGIASVHRLLWLFGERTVEQWYNTGEALFPFTRVQGGFMEIGCLATHSIAIADNTVFWLGNDFMVYKAIGAQPVPVAGDDITRIIEQSQSPQSARSFVYRQEGKLFYVMLFPDLTLCLDVNTGLWHHRKSYDMTRWRVNCYAWQWKTHIVGDYSNGKLYELDMSTYDEDGAVLEREAISAPIGNRAGRHTVNKLFVDLSPGIGLDGSVQGSSPLVMMAQSRDGGRTYSPELTRSPGAIGDYGARAQFARLGQARNRVIRIRVTDPVKAVLMGVYGEVERLAS